MKCNKCGGKVMVDRTFDQNQSLELFCLPCGKRWMVSRTKNAFGRVLDRIERQYVNG